MIPLNEIKNVTVAPQNFSDSNSIDSSIYNSDNQNVPTQLPSSITSSASDMSGKFLQKLYIFIEHETTSSTLQ